jgi:ABC-type glycerol-3-phosphate transport system permease component
MAKAFFNTLTVTIPATIIPIVIAAFAAYALAWMEFPGPRAADRGGRRRCWWCRCNWR